jgi:hypothetical protein
MRPIKSLKGKRIAIVGLGNSQIDYIIGRENSVEWDEVWGINAVATVLQVDRLFMMDPASRFLDTDDAGGQTEIMRKTLPKLDIPIYTCELDARVPAAVEYPLDEVINYSKCAYLNNTVPFAIAFAYWNQVAEINLFGLDYSYEHNLHFAEAGRACVEFWLAKCIEKNIAIGCSQRSSLLDQNVVLRDRLYGYHRLADPMVAVPNKDKWLTCKSSELDQRLAENNLEIPDKRPKPPEPYRG